MKPRREKKNLITGLRWYVMVTIDGDKCLRVLQYKRDNRGTADGRRTVVANCTAGVLVVRFEMCRFRFLATAGDSSFQI